MPKTSDGEQAAAIVNKACEQLQTLLDKNWTEIERIMINDSGEITLSTKINITDRKSKPGEQAAIDNRIKTVVSFAEKHSDSCESELPNPAQTEMDMG